MKNSPKDRLRKYGFGGEEKPKKDASTFSTQEEVDAANLAAKRFALRRGLVSGENTYVAKKPGDKKPFVIYQGSPLPQGQTKKLATKLPSGMTLKDIKGDGNAYWYEDPQTGDIVDIDPGVVFPQFRVAEPTSFAGGGIVGLANQIPGIADALMGLFENNPKAYSKQPTFNATTMRQMVTPYAMGGQIDEETMAQLQQMADDNGITVEELLAQLQSEGTEEEPEEELDEEAVEEFAMGGQAKKVIEVEGDEVIETPQGKLGKVKGPSHEEGGVDIAVPGGTKIYSDRLSVDGKTMQQRKLSREKTMARLQRLAEKNPADKLLKATLKRTAETTKQEEEQDMALQKIMNSIYNGDFQVGGNRKFGYGDEVPFFDKTGWRFKIPAGMYTMDDPELPTTKLPGKEGMVKLPASVPATPGVSTTPPTLKMINKAMKGLEETEDNGFTAGDYVGMAGNLFNAIAPIINTRKNAQGNKPNVNRYLGFGQKAIDTNDDAQSIAGRMKGTQLTDIETDANTARARARNSASSVNTLRALDAVTDMGTAKAKQSANDSFSRTMMGLLGQRGQLESQQDQMEMKGEQMRDLEDKGDRDNFYSNMAENLVNFGTNVQGLGKSLNVKKSNAVDAKLISQLSQYGLGFDEDGNLITSKKNG